MNASAFFRWAVVVILLGACSGVRAPDAGAGRAGVDTLNYPDPPYEDRGRIVDGVRYRHETFVSHGPHIRLDVHVGAFRAGSDSLTTLRLVGDEPLELRLYRTADRRGAAAWSSRGAGAGECRTRGGSNEPLPSMLPVGHPDAAEAMRRAATWEADARRAGAWIDTTSVHCGYAVPRVLGDTLPPGRYHLVAVLHTRSGVVAFPGPDPFLVADTLPPLGDPETLRTHLRYAARAWTADSVTPFGPGVVRWLETEVSVTNLGPRRVQMIHGSCPVRIRAYATPERVGRPAWSGGTGCDDGASRLVISPGETVAAPRFYLPLPIDAVLSDTLPAGTYHVTAELDLSGEEWIGSGRDHRSVWHDTTVQEPAGAVYLALPAPGLPTTRRAP